MSVKPIVAAALFVAASLQAENARLPYRLLYEIQKIQADWNHAHTNLLVVTVLQSTQPAVKTSDLSAYLDAKAGQIAVPIGNAGEFTLPLRDDLLAEDPWLITNQPKGTMRLNWQVGIFPGPLGKTVRYTRLMQPVRDSEQIQEQMRRYLPNSPKRTVTGLKLTFANDQKNVTLTIKTQNGPHNLRANDRNEIVLPLIPDWFEEDPEILLSTTPLALELVSRPAAE